MNRATGRSFAPLVARARCGRGSDPANITFHDPHVVRLCPSQPDRLYQQNHCGIYRIDHRRMTGAHRQELAQTGSRT